jgi:homoserine kinase type II
MLVLRLWPPHGPGPEHLERVHQWLRRAEGLGFIPTPITDEAGRTLQQVEGECWELSPWMPGAPDASRPPSPSRLRSAIAALAAFHLQLGAERRVDLSPGLGQRRETVSQLLASGFDALERAIRSSDDANRPVALRWLGLGQLVAPRLLGLLEEASRRAVVLQPCLRDARPDHFLFEGDRVTGLVDFGAMGIESVAGDLARLLGEWCDEGLIDRGEALAAYERIRPLDATEAGLINVFDASSNLLIGERWIRWQYVEGRRFDDPSESARGIAKGLARVERLAVARIACP